MEEKTVLILGYRIFSIDILLSHGFFHKHFQQASPYPEVTGPTGAACMRVKSLQLCPALCDPVDCSAPGSSVHGILQERILERVAMPTSGGSSRPRDGTHISRISFIARGIFPAEPLGCPKVERGICATIQPCHSPEG